MRTTTIETAESGRSPLGAHVRFLMDGPHGNMIHSTVPPGMVGRACHFRSIDEYWLVLSGEGEVWRSAPDGDQSVTRLVPGVCVDIPLGTTFQYRCTGDVPLVFTCTALPPWPGDDEAVIVDGPWEPRVDPEPRTGAGDPRVGVRSAARLTGVTWRIEIGPDQLREDETTERLVEHNQEASAAIRRRFEPANLPARPVSAYAIDDTGELLGGCVGSTVDVWHWLTVDLMWVRPSHRAQGLGRRLLTAVEEQARERGCRWAKLNTWEFQAPDFYARCGYVTYGRETDFPPGHTNHLMRKDL